MFRKVVRDMNISTFKQNDNVFFVCESIKGYSFSNVSTWADCALLPVICVHSGQLRDSFAHFYHIEYLLPHIPA